MTTQLTYLYDPLCGWCYGASGVIAEIAARPEIVLTLIPTGLFLGDGARVMDNTFADYAWANDQRIAQLTGQVFSDAYRQHVLAGHQRRFDSAAATLALTAVALSAPEQELPALKAIQAARYVDGRDITNTAILSEVLHAAGLNEAAARIASADAALLAANQQRLDAAHALMRQFNTRGVPVVIVGSGSTAHLIKTDVLFGDRAYLLAQL